MRALGDQAQVERHADGGEEEAEQQPFEGSDVGLELVAVGGVGEQHAGDERAQRRREPRLLHHQRDADHGQQRACRHRLLHARARHQPVCAVEHEAADDHHGDDDADGLQGRQQLHLPGGIAHGDGKQRRQARSAGSPPCPGTAARRRRAARAAARARPSPPAAATRRRSTRATARGPQTRRPARPARTSRQWRPEWHR